MDRAYSLSKKIRYCNVSLRWARDVNRYGRVVNTIITEKTWKVVCQRIQCRKLFPASPNKTFSRGRAACRFINRATVWNTQKNIALFFEQKPIKYGNKLNKSKMLPDGSHSRAYKDLWHFTLENWEMKRNKTR